MQFEYEISEVDYAAAQRLLWKLMHGHRHFRKAVAWVLLGAFFVFIAWQQRVIDWAPILLAGTGAWLIYHGLQAFFPGRYLLGAYERQGIAGHKYHAELDEEGFEVIGETWRHRISWAGVRYKGENKKVVVLSTGIVIYMFGKQYLSDEQQQEFRRLSGLSTQ